MFGKIHQKLRSGRGASLLIALLLFLVCSVVGIVVLTAASATAGRASKLAENDQRYYSVASAAELLAAELDKQKVKIVREEETQTETTTVYSYVDGDFLPGTPIPGTKTVTYTTLIGETEELAGATTNVYGSDYSAVDRSFLTSMAVSLMFGKAGDTKNGACNGEAAFGWSFTDRGSGSYVDDGEFSLEPSYTGTDLKIKGEYLLRGDGMLYITIWNAKEDDSKDDTFALVLTLQPDFSEGMESQEVKEPVAGTWAGLDSDSPTYTETQRATNTVKKTNTVTWNVIGIGEKSDLTKGEETGGDST